jgi:hypothetical protein
MRNGNSDVMCIPLTVIREFSVIKKKKTRHLLRHIKTYKNITVVKLTTTTKNSEYLAANGMATEAFSYCNGRCGVGVAIVV